MYGWRSKRIISSPGERILWAYTKDPLAGPVPITHISKTEVKPQEDLEFVGRFVGFDTDYDHPSECARLRKLVGSMIASSIMLVLHLGRNSDVAKLVSLYDELGLVSWISPLIDGKSKNHHPNVTMIVIGDEARRLMSNP